MRFFYAQFGAQLMPLDITNPETISKLTNQAIPTTSAQPIKVNNIQDIGTWPHDTVAYETTWADGRSIPLVLRAYRSPITYWQTEDHQQRNREWAVLRRLRLDGFPAPRPLARGEAGGQPFIIWQNPTGQIEFESSQGMAQQLKPLIPQLANLLASLHALDHNSLNNEPLYQATVAGSLVRMLLWSREIENDLLRQAVARLKPAVAQLKSWAPRLLHGNPHFGNLLLDQGQITRLINWEHSAIGDPRWDVMTAAHWLRPEEPELAAQLVNWYETFTGRSIDNRPFWWAMVSVRLWTIKIWTQYAVQQQMVSEDFLTWTEDLPQAEARAFQDLVAAGL